MYKKIMGMAIVALLAIGAWSITKANTVDNTNMALTDLLKVNVANAECYDDMGVPMGMCVAGGYHCVYIGQYADCTHSTY